MTANSQTIPATNKALREALITNALLERQVWLQRLLDPRRDIDVECGHPREVLTSDFLRFFRRNDIASRVVSVWPEESWSERPDVYENEDPEDTAFEEAWKKLEKQLALFPLLQRADILSGIGRFGVILLGFDDGKSLETPIAGPGTDNPGNAKLLYVRTFEESVVQVSDLERDRRNPRYGLPSMYNVGFNENATETNVTTQSKVHWTRIIHLADNRLNSEIYGLPRMEKVFNRLLDLRKISGGSGEMFWKGGFPGLSLESLPEVLSNGTVELDTDATKTQLEAYMNGLQRYIATVGMRANSLKVEVADPSPHVDGQLKLIATALGIPWRVFVGSEAAQLASEQDIRSWNRRVNRRRNEYLTPYVLMPLITRLIDAGSLPKPKDLYVAWPDLNTPSDKDKAVVAESRTNALTKYVTGGVSQLIPPFHYLTLILNMTDAEAKSIVDASELELDKAGDLGIEPEEEAQNQPSDQTE